MSGPASACDRRLRLRGAVKEVSNVQRKSPDHRRRTSSATTQDVRSADQLAAGPTGRAGDRGCGDARDVAPADSSR